MYLLRLTPSVFRYSIVLDNGTSVFSGDVSAAIDYYINQHNKKVYVNPVVRQVKNKINGPTVLKCSLKNEQEELKSFFTAGEKISLQLEVQPDVHEKRKYAVVWFIFNSFDEEFAVCSSGKMNDKYYEPETTKIRCEIDSTGLLPDDYSIRLVLHVPGDDNFDDWKQVVNFNILSHDINKTGFEYTSIWSPKTFLKSEWH